MASKSQVIVIKDKNTDLAIAEGLSILGVERDKVDIEILEKGKEGFLGIGTKLAKVKLILKSKSEAKQNYEFNMHLPDIKVVNQNQNEAKDIIGFNNNKIKLNKLFNKKYPVINSDKNIDIFEDGKLIEGPFIITDNSDMEYQIKNIQPNNEIIVNVNDDKLKVFLEIRKRNGKLLEPLILPAANDETDLLITTEVIKEIEPLDIIIDDIYWELDKLKISYGVKEEQIIKAINNPNIKHVIAEGDAPIEGSDAKIEYLYENEFNNNDFEDPSKNIDYFSLNKISSVKKGEIIAIKHPVIPGENGRDVYNNEIQVKQPQNIRWHIGEGVKIVGDKAVAIKSGCPTIENGKLVVNETYVINDDVDIEVGNIAIHGNVFIVGNVCENIEIKATGMIKIAGNATQAILKAEGDIIVKGNIIDSKVIAGEVSTFYQNCYKNLNELKFSFEEMEKAIYQLKSHRSFKVDDLMKYGESQIIQLLIDTKYKDIPDIIKNIYELDENNEMDDKWMIDELDEVINLLQNKIKITGLCKMKKISEIIELKDSIGDVCQLLEKVKHNNSNIWAGYIQNSDIRASGSIVVAKEGVYNTNLLSGNKVIFKGKPGLFRGGKITAENDIFINDLGSPGGSKVEVQVPFDSKIEAHRVYSNVSIKIGRQQHKFTMDQTNISAHLNDEGKLLLF